VEAKPRISGKDATCAAMEAQKYPPVHIRASVSSEPSANTAEAPTQVPATVDLTSEGSQRRKAPPRVRKPSPQHDQFLAPTSDIAGYRARTRRPRSSELASVVIE
jgi:hypothetical protein